MKDFGVLVHQIRTDKSMSLRELSSLSDVSLGYLSDLENGKFCPSLDVANRISESLGLKLWELLKHFD